MEVILFTMVGVMLYVVSDSILKAIEKKKGQILENRSIVFFGIITVLALITFNTLQYYGPKLGLLPEKQAQTQSADSQQPVEKQTPPKN